MKIDIKIESSWFNCILTVVGFGFIGLTIQEK